ncbi:MAG: hypothetical protein S4CHLAM45_01380 [Chlamydiales bacterium]|nr:hypothetical protein [Chlamydiales bacterium]MCH9619458.1 hypothetical protein [Chlamydiales bacterium]MCH9622262.1 hypothetical protein [Chlamydiales bacterium]
MSSDARKTLDEILHLIGQHQLLDHLKTDEEYGKVLRQIKKMDLELFSRQQQALLNQEKKKPLFVPPTLTKLEGDSLNPEDIKRFGCLILAGGQASRLRLKGLKGFMPTSLIQQKSLFQLLAEKVAAASKQYNYPIPLAFMTSTEQRTEAETFFIRHSFFGLKPSQVSFCSQSTWPLLNFNGDLFFSGPGELCFGPNGNGDIFKQFVKSGIYQKWQRFGIEHVRVLPVDNPLALPVDDALFSHHLAHQNDITIETIKKEKGEKAGTLSLIEGKLGVLEYGEFEEEVPDQYANVGLFLFSLSFMARAAELNLPLHIAKKAAKTVTGEIPEKPNAWKFETFIFDTFSASEKSEAILFERESIFAPLKNLEGADSIATVQAALLAHEQKLLETLTGHCPPEGARFELCSSFYYPTAEQKARWKGKPFPQKTPYIEDL